MPTTIDNDTELSAVNSILGSIGQSPVNSLNLQNPEIEFVYNVLTEVNKDVQNEGWLFNLEEDQTFLTDDTPADLSVGGTNDGTTANQTHTGIPTIGVERSGSTDNGFIKLADSVLNVTLRKGGKVEKKIHATTIRNKIKGDGTANPDTKFDNSVAAGTDYITVLYDLENNTNLWDIKEALYTVDVVTLYEFERVPTAFQRYITYRSAVRAATQLIANPQLVALLQLQEVTARANCLEYEGKQGDHSFFGLPNSKRLPSQLLQRTQQS